MNEIDLWIGEPVQDTEQDDDHRAYVIDIHDQTADEYRVEGTGSTVHDYNESYPADDQVVEIAFSEDVGNKIGIAEKQAQLKSGRGDDFGEVFRRNVQNLEVRTYAYPSSRLESQSD
ncbi:hypothetical protein EGH22_00270 [Halomicroarcula sp. F28]|uniref:hypothetical protein n=1 Tax=Haloarcula salinisoli TaxID=2487746 RepID=UPI001C739483|nr:hypothetical protein [Halomicroarcula salinisoli]MBX0284751.1 hypothetical protein [Halomicroarcula salinisoli]